MRMKSSSWKILIFLLLSTNVLGQVQFRIPQGILTDGMVLQMEPKRAHIWGWGVRGASVEVMLNGDRIVSTYVQDDAHWIAALPPQPPGGPHQITIEYRVTPQRSLGDYSDRETKIFEDVMFGDVWVCAGEGNMEFPMKQILNSTSEIEHALNYADRIRVMKVDHYASPDRELSELVNKPSLPWQPISQDNVDDFPAVCLIYAVNLAEALKSDSRPLGLIAVTWQDSNMESWVSSRVLEKCSTPPSTPGGLKQRENSAVWNGMLKPVTFTAIRGAIWSQGESNVAQNLSLYNCQFKEFISECLETFPDADVPVTSFGWGLPFGIVQSGPMPGENDAAVGELRYHQTLDSEVAPNGWQNETFIALTYDLTDTDTPYGSAYYRDKKTVAKRLSDAARFLIYDETNLSFVGPIPSSAYDWVRSTMNISFLTQGVKILNKVGEPSGFSYEMEDEGWIACDITSVDEDSIEIYVHQNYTALAYAYSAVSCPYLSCPIYDTHGLPHITMYFETFRTSEHLKQTLS